MFRKYLIALALLVALVSAAFVMSQRVSEFKAGMYSTTTEGDKISITFAEAGQFTVTTNGELDAEGSYKVTGDEIELADEKGPGACRGDLKVGRYSWKLAGKELMFTRVEDGCEGRADILTSLGWQAE